MNPNWFEANRSGWNVRTPVHLASKFYDVESWLAGRNSLGPVEIRELAPVAGKHLLHLQCHFGQDTLSWARLGARVTGCDLSDEAIKSARELASRAGLEAEFVCCNLYDYRAAEPFDIVFTSYGAIGWLPDLDRWAEVIVRSLKRGGVFYMVEFHPIVWMFDERFERIEHSYHNSGPIESDNTGTYTDGGEHIRYKDFGWNHSLSEVVNSLIRQGLRIEFLNEHLTSPQRCMDVMIEESPGEYWIRGLEGKIPLLYSLRATRPSAPHRPGAAPGR